MKLEKYKQILDEKGKDLSGFGVDAIALNQIFALKAIAALKEEGVAIFGGDVYKIINGKFKSTYDNWYCQENNYNNKEEEYLKQSWAISEKYIKGYDDPKDDSVFYTLVIPTTETDTE